MDEKVNAAKTQEHLLLTGLEKTLQKRWSSFNLLKMPCLKRNPALASPSGIETGICTSEVRSSLSIASHLSTRR